MNYAYWLANIPGIGCRTIYKLLAQVGSAKELYFLNEKQLEQLSGMEHAHLEQIRNSKKEDWEKKYDKLSDLGITFLSAEDESFPSRLKHIADPPYVLYYKGRLPREDRRTVAIVGARMCSEYGHAVAKELGLLLSAHGVEVVSGMAKGIDSDGHFGALEAGGRTYAVLGCGPDICYPSSGRELYGQILESGGIISEYPPGTRPKPGYFPCRNRIIAGLSDVVVVVEAKARSGSLITADLALEQGKEVFAVPGRIYDTQSAGCNALIQQGAGIITDGSEFLRELGLGAVLEPVQENFMNFLLEKEERLVYSCVDLRPKNMEELLRMSGFSMQELAVILDRLVQKGFVTETFKNYYIRII